MSYTLAYRQLLKTATMTEQMLRFSRPGGLVLHVRNRFREMANENKMEGKPYEEILRQTEQVDYFCAALEKAQEVRELYTILNALAMGVGSPAYIAKLEMGYMQFVEFDQERVQRGEVDQTLTEERQNQVLLKAMVPYAEILEYLHRSEIPIEDLKALIASPRDKVDQHLIQHGEHELILVEIDDASNKQTIYIRCPDYDKERDGTVDADAVAPGELRNTLVHGRWYNVAERLLSSVIAETPLHRSRGTVLVGHGTGGAVAIIMAMLLAVRGFDIKNTITLGAPKCVIEPNKEWLNYQHKQDRDHPTEMISAIRVVLAGDPITSVPDHNQDSTPYMHVGETLVISSPESRRHNQSRSERSAEVGDDGFHGDDEREITRDFSPAHYYDTMQRPVSTLNLTYHPAGQASDEERVDKLEFIGKAAMEKSGKPVSSFVQ